MGKYASSLYVSISLAIWAGLVFLLAPTGETAKLNNFEIETHPGESVKIILHTDTRTPYTTESTDNGFSVILPETSLAPKMTAKGLPVVTDNQNQFVGQAIPMENGHLRITLPTLPKDQYAVSVIQKPEDATTGLTPRLSYLDDEKHLDRNVETYLREYEKNQNAKTETASKPSRETASSTPARPIIVKTPRRSSRSSSRRKKNSNAMDHKNWLPIKSFETLSHGAFQPGINTNEAFSTLALSDEEETLFSPFPSSLVQEATITDVTEGPDLFSAELGEIALGHETNKTVAPDTNKTNVSAKAGWFSGFVDGLFQELRQIPLWIMIALGLFLSGIGLFALIGSLVLMRILFSPLNPSVTTAHAHVTPTPVQIPIGAYMAKPATPPSNTAAPLTPPSEPFTPERQPSKPQVDAETDDPIDPLLTELPDNIEFEDKARVNAFDYLYHSPENVKQAVQNTVLINFPTGRRKAKSNRRSKTVR
ncbi:MAG: alanine and proline-rich secreted protein Apa [Vampirovibrio sp.]|nr:alanine and proline-rich secreted protein Apa [Vampirovibrio sp.]